MSLKIYLAILRWGVYLSFLSVFLVFSNLLFPFITSKQIYFNILIELLMIFWLGLIITYPEARPKKFFITFGLAGFFAALLLSSIFSVDFNLSFWGDIERMLGWFHVIHFFLFYLIIITVFRSAKDWRNLFIVSLTAATLVCLYSLFKIPYSTIGNTAYVSGYAIFNFYFALLLFMKQMAKSAKTLEDWLIGSIYLIIAFISALVMKQTHTRGAYVGLGISLVMLFILFAIYQSSRKIKIYSLSAVVLAVIAVSLVFMFPRSKIITSSPLLSTITQISSKALTFQTRLISWKAALKDFPNHWILGTGYGNYAITFDKFFDPKFYSFTASETYFDRAHNNLVDIASTGGLISLIAYLFIFAATGYYLVQGKRRRKIPVNEFIILSCLLVAYFIQNLAVFDSLVTYISLMVALGYVYFLLNNQEEAVEPEPTAEAEINNKEIGALVAAGLVFFIIIYQYNVKPLMMLDGTIQGQIKFSQGKLAEGVEEYKKALSYETGLDRDSRASLINSLYGLQGNFLSLNKERAKEIADYAVILGEANVKLNPEDSMMQMQLAQALSMASLANQDNLSKFYFYSDRSLKAMGESIKASPGRVTTYFGKAQIYIIRNEKGNALNTLRYAVSLNDKFSESYCYLAKTALYFKEEKEGYDSLDKCLDLGGANYVTPLDFLKTGLEHYERNKDQARVIKLLERLADLEPGNAKAWINLALLYKETGKKEQAAKAAVRAMEIDKSLRSAAEEFIRQLEK